MVDMPTKQQEARKQREQ